jgi:bifunctional UDP-N-acetylglucosamine pyrophosphorylase/glucosamine-1-phosphate N-acetyltransferase
VGSGSVITDDVPAGALALGRGRQVNKPGWKPKAANPKQSDKKAAAKKPKLGKKR